MTDMRYLDLLEQSTTSESTGKTLILEVPSK